MNIVWLLDSTPFQCKFVKRCLLSTFLSFAKLWLQILHDLESSFKKENVGFLLSFTLLNKILSEVLVKCQKHKEIIYVKHTSSMHQRTSDVRHTYVKCVTAIAWQIFGLSRQADPITIMCVCVCGGWGGVIQVIPYNGFAISRGNNFFFFNKIWHHIIGVEPQIL